jgi:GT2 family glycosyltransferase
MIVVCTPTYGHVQATFAYDLADFMRHNPQAIFSIADGSIIGNNRASLARSALEKNASHILFIDSDMRFPPTFVGDLIKQDLDFVAANCRPRVNRGNWTARKGDKFISSAGKTGSEEVDTIGFGVALIKADVFRKTPEPWFASPFDGKKLVGEDVFFCAMVRKAGFKIHVDHDLSQRIKHTATLELGVE